MIRGYVGPAWLVLGMSAALLAASKARAQQEGVSTPVLRDIFGASHRFDEFVDPVTKAVVVVVMDEHCPVLRQYVPRLIAMNEHYNGYLRDRAGGPVRRDEQGREHRFQYEGERVAFLGVYVTADLSVKRMAAHALNSMVPFRVLHDSRLGLVEQYGLSRLSEVLVLDDQMRVRYQGAIDDQFFQGGAKPEPTQHYLRDAIDALLSDAQPPRASTPPVGCRITRPLPPSPSDVSYHEHLKPILQNRCERCHRPGEVAPMPLTSYRELMEYAEMVEEVVLDERMPPFPGDLPPDSHRHFAEDDRLSEDERAMILAWCRGGRQRGEPQRAPAEIQWPPKQEWSIGEPDLVFEMNEPFRVPANGLVDYVYYPVKVNLPEDKWISAIETMPGDARVVHHIQVHEYRGRIFDKGLSPVEQFLHYGLSIEGGKLIGAYTPGNQDNARRYDQPPKDVAAANWQPAGMKLSAGANLIFELHYTPIGEEIDDRSRVAIKFASAPPPRELHTHFFFRKRGDFLVPANVQHHSMQQIYPFHAPAVIYQIRPHFHVRGKSYRLELVDSADLSIADIHDFSMHNKPRGEVVLTVPAWDFNWQLTYKFKSPLIVPAGKVLLATGYWDNTRHNPHNPNPNEDVRWGQQTIQEMFNTLFVYEELAPNDPRLTPSPAQVSRAENVLGETR